MQDVVEDTSEKITETTSDTPYLSAKELTSLRKPIEVKLPPAIGEKFYVADTGNEISKKAVGCAQENFRDVLQQKRAARICFLMQAEWNEESFIAVAKKLKGKFVQHVGHPIQGRTEVALSPEEAVFMLENGHMEVSNGGMPMSTEEAYAVMLKGHLAIEKYHVYSHLSRLGFLVVKHNLKLDVTRYEKLMNLDKHKLKKSKKTKANVETKSTKKKSLDFSGCISNKEITIINSPHLENHLTEQPNAKDNVGEQAKNNVGEQATDNVNDKDNIKDKDNVKDKEKVKAKDNVKDKDNVKAKDNVENKDNVEEQPEDNNLEHSEPCEDNLMDHSESVPCKIKMDTSVEHMQDKSKSTLSVLSDDSLDFESNMDCVDETSKEQSKMAVDSIIAPIDTELQKETLGVDISSCELLPPSVRENNFGEISAELGITGDEANQAQELKATEDVADDENSTDVSESSVDDASAKHSSEEELSDDKDDSCDCVCVSTKDGDSWDSEVESVDLGKQGKSFEKQHQVDDEIFFVEVKKKESKPMAVIDILSDDDDSEMVAEGQESDDDVQVIEVCKRSSPRQKRPNRKAFTKFLGCKKESNTAANTSSIKVKNSGPQWPFPDLAGKNFVCLSRPPSYLLPPNVRLGKEAYPYDRGNSRPEQRLWNSYRDLQDRGRHQRYHNNPGFTQGSRYQQDYPRDYHHPPDRNAYNNPSRHSYPPMDAAPPIAPYVPPPFTGPPPNHLGHTLLKNCMASGNLNPNLLNMQPNAIFERVAEEVQRTALSVATSMLSSMFGAGANQITVPEYSTQAAKPTHMGHPGINPHEQQRSLYNLVDNARLMSSPQENRFYPRDNVSPWLNEQPSRTYPDSTTSDFARYQNDERPWSSRSFYENRRFPRRDFRHRYRSREEFKRNVYPSAIPRRNNSHSWRDLKAIHDHAIETVAAAARGVDDDDEDNSNNNNNDDDDDIEEIPININDVLWSKEINPLVKPGSELPVVDVLTSLKITKSAQLSEKVHVFEKYLPTSCSLEISFDVYLPGSSYRRSCPSIPNHRIVVVRSTDPFPKLSDIVFLQRKFNDGALLQFAVVDNGDVAFYSFNNVELPSLIPHEQ